MIFGILLAVLLVVLFCPVSLSIGKTQVNKSVLKVDKAAALFPQGFAHLGWDGPTGSMSSGDCYSLRMGDWLWCLDIQKVGIDLKDVP